jgi:hypothetical protein
MENLFQCGQNFNRYYTVMSPLPEGLNREQMLSLLSANSQIKSLTVLLMKSVAGTINRIGLVGVDDDESLFRLTSRRFMVQGTKIRHLRIRPEAKLVKYFVQKTMPVILRYYSTNRRASSLVFDFFSRFGDLEWVGLKAANGYHELSLNASKQFSVRELTTDLGVQVGDIWVELEYPEEMVSLQYFQNDLDLLKEIKNVNKEPIGSVSEQATFFRQNISEEIIESSESSVISQEANIVELHGQNYRIENDELSLDEEEEEENEKAHFSSHFYKYEGRDPSGFFDFFNTEALLSSYGLGGYKLASQRENQSDCFYSLKKNTRSSRPQIKINVLSNASETKQTTPLSASFAAQSKQQKFKTKKGKHETMTASKPTVNPPLLPSHTSQPSKGQNIVQSKTQALSKPGCEAESPTTSLLMDTEKHVEDQISFGNDGSQLLSMILTICDDFDQINDKVMPEVHNKWRRFVEIKDTMRREKYNEYLLSKKKENLIESSGGACDLKSELHLEDLPDCT